MKIGTLILFIVSTFLVLFLSCSDSSWDLEEYHTTYEESVKTDKHSLKKKEKCTACHYQKSKNSFKKLSISCNALNAHLGHGDGEIGGSVPGQEGFIFDEHCELVKVEEECPCFTLEELLSMSGWTGFCEGDQGCLVASRGQLAYQNLMLNQCELYGRGVTTRVLATTPGEASACAKIIHDFIALVESGSRNNPNDARCNL